MNKFLANVLSVFFAFEVFSLKWFFLPFSIWHFFLFFFLPSFSDVTKKEAKFQFLLCKNSFSPFHVMIIMHIHRRCLPRSVVYLLSYVLQQDVFIASYCWCHFCRSSLIQHIHVRKYSSCLYIIWYQSEGMKLKQTCNVGLDVKQNI